MMSDETKADQVESLLETPDLASALESEQFKKFLDQVPIAIGVSQLPGNERIVYANPEFENLSGIAAAQLAGQQWAALPGSGLGDLKDCPLGDAIVSGRDLVGTFEIKRRGQEPALIDVYSNVIENDDGTPCFRLVALVDVTGHEGKIDRAALETRLRDKDTLLLELQHRVKNNLQMITALIRLETREAAASTKKSFERLAGRVDSLAILYQALSDGEHQEEIDLGVYLSQIASAVMASHAVEGIRLNLKVDTYPVSINVAMPAGLVVNELMTNALKHAFVGRPGGTITVHSIVDGNGCRVIVGDDGVGLPPGEGWPKEGKLGALIAQSLRENAKADLEVDSSPESGTRITIIFKRSAAAAPPAP